MFIIRVVFKLANTVENMLLTRPKHELLPLPLPLKLSLYSARVSARNLPCTHIPFYHLSCLSIQLEFLSYTDLSFPLPFELSLYSARVSAWDILYTHLSFYHLSCLSIRLEFIPYTIYPPIFPVTTRIVSLISSDFCLGPPVRPFTT